MLKNIKEWLFVTQDGKRLHISTLTTWFILTAILFGFSFAIITTPIIGVCKEVYVEKIKKTFFSFKDLGYDAMAIFYGMLTTGVLYGLFPKFIESLKIIDIVGYIISLCL